MIDESIKELEQKANAAASEAASAKFKYKEAAISLIRLKKNIPNHHYIKLGTWACKDSLTGKCAYDMTDENLMGDDECMFCGDPDERQ